MFLVFVIIVVVIVVIAKGNGYWAADKRNKVKMFLGGEEGYCHECKHCGVDETGRYSNTGLFCGLSRCDHITKETRMTCFEKPTVTEADLKEIFSLDLWTSAGKIYISQNLSGKKMTFSEVDAFLKRLARVYPHYLKGNEKSPGTNRPAVTASAPKEEEYKRDYSKSLEQQLIGYAEHYKQPRYKIDMLRESFRRGYEMEANGFHVIESIKNKLPYFCETELEEDSVIDVLKRKTDERPIKKIMDAASFYNESNSAHSHDLKRKFWQDKIVDAARNGNREAQGALCSNYARTVFSDRIEELEQLIEQYEGKLWEDAQSNDKHALLGVGAWMCGAEYERAIELLAKSAAQGLTDAYYWLARMTELQCYEKEKTLNEAEQAETHKEMRLKILEYYRKGAECANGTWTRDCQREIASAYEDGDEIPQNLDLANYWYKKAAELGDEYSKRHLEPANRI